jgi:hypothetical protein
MKLPYTPVQAAYRHADETDAPAETLGGMPVVCCSIHSQLAPVCAGIGADVRAAYVQLPGGALPVSLSDTVRVLKGRGLIGAAIAVGACVDGDVACVSAASALAWAAGRGFDVVVCGIGPGIVGTGSRFGHGGVAAAAAANAAAALGGSPVIAARTSAADLRERHRGVSHHVRSIVQLCLGEVVVAWPAGRDVPDGLALREVAVDGWKEACAGLPLQHMGRSANDDPVFFESAFAAGVLARTLL